MNQPAASNSADVSFSRLAQGYWRLKDWQRTPSESLAFLQAHIDLGITTVDHADLYGDYEVEALFGETLKLAPEVRHSLQIVTKCDIQLLTDKAPQRQHKHYDSSAGHIEASVNRSLSNLHTDYIDVLLLHRPDPLLNADEVALAFERLQTAGKVKHFGVSNFNPFQFELLQDRLSKPLITNQIEINPLNNQLFSDGTLDCLQKHRIRPMAWSCLAGGRLLSGGDDAAVRCRTKLAEVGEELGGAGPDQVALAWVLKLPGAPVPILGSGRIERTKAAVEACEIKLSRDQWFGIWEAANGQEVP